MHNPVFYVRQAATFEGDGDLRPGTAHDDTITSELVLVRLNSSKDKRVEQSMSTNGFNRDAKRKLNEISDYARQAGQWLAKAESHRSP